VRLPGEYTLVDLPGERPLQPRYGRWQYVAAVTAEGDRIPVYYHLTCDCVADEEGFCVGCRAPSPTVLLANRLLEGSLC
jgi:hypothetical protein